jgi:hypothetical protein
MREIAISKFKATCLAVMEEVRRTRTPVRITRFGRAVAEVVPPREERKGSWLGCMNGTIDISVDIVKPIGAFDDWKVAKK